MFSTGKHAYKYKHVLMSERIFSKQAKVDTCGGGTGNQKQVAIRGDVNLNSQGLIVLQRAYLEVLLMYLNNLREEKSLRVQRFTYKMN